MKLEPIRIWVLMLQANITVSIVFFNLYTLISVIIWDQTSMCISILLSSLKYLRHKMTFCLYYAWGKKLAQSDIDFPQTHTSENACFDAKASALPKHGSHIYTSFQHFFSMTKYTSTVFIHLSVTMTVFACRIEVIVSLFFSFSFLFFPFFSLSLQWVKMETTPIGLHTWKSWNTACVFLEN